MIQMNRIKIKESDAGPAKYYVDFQNNHGGSYIIDDDQGMGHWIIIKGTRLQTVGNAWDEATQCYDREYRWSDQMYVYDHSTYDSLEEAVRGIHEYLEFYDPEMQRYHRSGNKAIVYVHDSDTGEVEKLEFSRED